MKAGAALVLSADPGEAGRRAAETALASLGEGPPGLGVLFASGHFLDSAEDLLAAVTAQAGPLPLIGCVCEAVAGGDREVEAAPAVSLWLAAGLGPAETFAMEFLPTASGGAFGGYRFEPGRDAACLLVCDPFTFPAEYLLAHLNEHAAGTLVMGGMASGGLGARRSRLFLDGQVRAQGAVGAYLPGTRIHPLVSQGCRPVGQPFTVTAAEGTLVRELGGRPAMTRLQEMAGALSPRDRELLARGVQVGIVMNEYGTERHQGDFLIRSVLGAQPESGAIAVGDEVEVGQTLQFHVRDADSADKDLHRLLDQEAAALGGSRPAGALLFTCNGRGSRLFPEPGHDARLLASTLGGIPMAGFFCAGELGPVGGQNYLHAFTASIAVFPGPAG